MTISEIINRLRQERDLGSRFPARIIFIENLSEYSALVTQLRSACDVTINIAEFGKKDVVPQFNKIREFMRQYEGKQILLLSVGEYLRMCIKRELNKERAQFPPFWEAMQQESSKTRYIMPMFACRDSFDRIVGKIDERQESYVWTLEQPDSNGKNDISRLSHYLASVNHISPKNYNISVYSPQFSGAINADADNFESWLRNWDTILKRNEACSVITNQYRNTEASYGTININPIDSPFTYLCNLIKGSEAIKRNWENDEFWAKLIPGVKKGMTFSDVVLDQLDITTFDFVSVVARWDTLNKFQRELIWMWYRVYPTEEYYSYVCKKAQIADEIPERIKNEILEISSRSQKWIEERMKAMRVLRFVSFDDAYFKALDKLPVPEMKLQLLTYKTHEECAFAIKTVSSMLRNGAELEAVADILKDSYPLLFAYMSKKSGIDNEIDEYFFWYRRNKLINRFPGSYAKPITYERFDARFKQLNKMSGKDCFTLWIDGFGMEWFPVFLEELERRGIKPESTSIATAKLPTETEYNHQWDENDPLCEKWNRLDSFSHKGMPDDKSYFSCIAYQLDVFTEVAKKVDDLLSKHEYVLITGDHGSSRLAALAFHNTSVVPVSAPANAKVRSFGRFCELADDGNSFATLDFMRKVPDESKTYIVMKDYNRFSVSGNAAGGNSDDQDIVGEIHGGDTPEERLVPVVIVKRSQPVQSIMCQSEKFVTRKNGHVETTLSFNLSIFSLEVTANSIHGICTKIEDKIWSVSFDGVTDDELVLILIANDNLLDKKILLKVKCQGIEKNAGMGGLP